MKRVKMIKKTVSLLLAAVILFACSAMAAEPIAKAADGKWVATWASSLVDGSISISSLALQDVLPSKSTIRIELTVTTGGIAQRFKFSNQYGKAAITIDGASVAKTLSDGSADIVDGTQTPITFRKKTAVTIPAGETVWSDSIPFATSALEKISVSLYFSNLTYITSTGLSNGRTFLSTNLLLSADKASQINTATISNNSEINITSGTITYHTIPFLSAISSYSNADNPATAVFIGDSTLVNDTYLYYARKLVNAGYENISVINEAIIGNKLLSDGTGLIGNLYGQALIDRFQRDVLDIANVKYVFVKIGLNDILHQFTKSLSSSTPKYTSDDIISGYRSLVNLAHDNGIKIYFFTKTPWKGYARSFLNQTDDLQWSYKAQKMCNELDEWVRTNTVADGYIDCWDLANPADEYALCPSFTLDGAHLTTIGSIALADLIPLSLVGVPASVKVASAAELEGVNPYAEKQQIIRDMNKQENSTAAPPATEGEDSTTKPAENTTAEQNSTTEPGTSPSADSILPTVEVPIYNEPTTVLSENRVPDNVEVNYDVIDSVTKIEGNPSIVFVLILITVIVISGAIVILTIGRKKEEF